MDMAEWLPSLCGDYSPTSPRAWANRPVLVRVLGQVWTVATDSRVMVAVAGVHADASPLDNPEGERHVRHYLGPNLQWAETVPAGFLRRAGGGAAYDDDFDAIPTHFLGQYFDRGLIAKAGAGFPDYAARVGWHVIPPEVAETVWGGIARPAVFDAPGRWRAVVMALEPTGNAVKYAKDIPALGGPLLSDLEAGWEAGPIPKVARAVKGSLGELPVLADLLDAAGSPDLAAHCREPHAGDRCWVLDLLLGKE